MQLLVFFIQAESIVCTNSENKTEKKPFNRSIILTCKIVWLQFDFQCENIAHFLLDKFVQTFRQIHIQRTTNEFLRDIHVNILPFFPTNRRIKIEKPN